jgi:hypothetical protein
MPMTFQNAVVTCRKCASVSYYRREIGVSARQITLLTARFCSKCGHKLATVQVSRSAAPAGVEVTELPDDDSIC